MNEALNLRPHAALNLKTWAAMAERYVGELPAKKRK